MDWQAEWQPGVMADNPALIPLVANKSRLIILFIAKHSFIHSCDGCVSPSVQPFRLPTIPIYYLFTIIPTDYSNKTFQNFILILVVS